LRLSTPLTLTQKDLDELKGLNDEVSLEEVADIYLPLSRLLNLYVGKAQELFQITDLFLGKPTKKVPFIIAIAGSVAVGKSTTARILQALLSRWPNHPRVDLVTTDGFLLPNKVLESRGLMRRKGFPESYDQRKLLNFVADVKSGKEKVTAPVYSHLVYDIVPGKMIGIKQPDILILEGLNVLQRGDDSSRVFVSDFFDFSIYVDAGENDLQDWYIKRFFKLRETAFQDQRSYFKHYAQLSKAEAKAVATELWCSINLLNLKENIAPTKSRASLILEKGSQHAVKGVKLRRL
jgi:type I pantothenate kinase